MKNSKDQKFQALTKSQLAKQKKEWAKEHVIDLKYILIKEEEKQLTRRIFDIIGHREGFDTAAYVCSKDGSEFHFVRNMFRRERCVVEVIYSENHKRLEGLRDLGYIVFQIVAGKVCDDAYLNTFVRNVRYYLKQFDFYNSGKSICGNCRNLCIDRRLKMEYYCKKYRAFHGEIRFTTSCDSFVERYSDRSVSSLRREEHFTRLNQIRQNKMELAKIPNLDRTNRASDNRCKYCGHRLESGSGTIVCPIRKVIVDGNDTCSKWASNILRKDKIRRHEKELENQQIQTETQQPSRGARPSKNK